MECAAVIFVSYLFFINILKIFSNDESFFNFEKNRDENLIRYGNIMYDRRVIRGNTYALNTLPAVSQSSKLNFIL